ncbi:MAG: hypothetical protein Q8Q23_05715 [bacterium]|nr:hypothetical protein [bacterium]
MNLLVAREAVICTHGEDVDGIISAFLLTCHLRGRGYKKFKYYFISYGRQLDCFRHLLNNKEEIKGKDLYVCDLNANDNLVLNQEGRILQNIALLVNKFTWIDHHDVTKKNAVCLLRHKIILIHRQNICASKIIYEEFLKSFNDDYFFWLSNIAQAQDYPTDDHHEEIKKIGYDLQKIISYHNLTPVYNALHERLLSLLSEANNWYDRGSLHERFNGVLRQCKLKEIAAKTMLERYSLFKDIKDKKFLLTYGHPAVSFKTVLKHVGLKFGYNYDALIVLFGSPIDNVIVCGNSDGGFKASKFCNFMGGGGREQMGGFGIGQISEKNYPYLADDIAEKLNDFL